jgi:fibronectin-binding autotransporter adhesin
MRSSWRAARLSGAVASFVTIAVIATLPAHADYAWSLPAGQVGDWSVASNWSGNAVPTTTSGDVSVWIVNGGTTTVTQAGEVYGALTVGNSAGSGSVQMTGGNLSSNLDTLYVGTGGTGSFTQTGGANGNNRVVAIGTGAGGYGTYTLGSSGVLSTQEMEVGNGNFIQSGGINNSNWVFFVGCQTGSNGTYMLSGGQLNASQLSIAAGGNGSFVQSGGTCSAARLDFCNGAGSGSYSLSGTSVLTAQLETLGDSWAAPGSSALFEQSGGTNSTPFLTISPFGRYQLMAGTLLINGGLQNQGVFDGGGGQGTLIVGSSSLVDFSQGETINTGSMSLSIGANSLLIVPPGFNPASAFGSYRNSGMIHTAGTPLVVAAEQGFCGSGTILDPVTCQGSVSNPQQNDYDSLVLQGGLVISGSGQVNLGSRGGVVSNNATSGMSGGTLESDYHAIGQNGTGTFTQSAGVNITSRMYLGLNSGDVGTYILSGSGVLSTQVIDVGYGGSGSFYQTGGTNTVSTISIGSSSNYTLGGNGLLSVSQLTVDAAAAVFNQSGGTAKVSVLYVGYSSYGSSSSGTFNLSGSGVLIANDIQVGNGMFTQNGGTAVINSLLYGGYDLNGGLLIVPNISGASSFNFSGGTLQFSGTASAAPMKLATGGGAVFDTAGHNVTLSGVLSGSGSLTKIGSGTLILSSANYTGGTIIDGGVLEGAPTNGGITINYGGALAANPSNIPALLSSGAIMASSSGALAITASYSGALNMSGLNYLYLGSMGNNTYSGVLSPGSNGYLLGDFGGTLTVTSRLPGSYGATINGNVVLTGSNTYSGPTSINAGTLQLGSSTALPVGTAATVNGTLDLNTFSASVSVLTGSGVVDSVAGGSPTLAVNSGNFGGTLQNTTLPLALNKTGSGTLLLTGANTYTGRTTVSAGMLVVNGSLFSAVTVDSGGTLGGAGSLTSVTVGSGGQIAPGSPLGALSIGGGLILASGAGMDYDLDTPSTSAFVLAHSVSLGGQQLSDFNITPTGNFGPGSYDLIEAGSFSGSLGSNNQAIIDGFPATLSVQNNDLVLTVVPEPSALAILAAGAMGLVGHGWRRRGFS